MKYKLTISPAIDPEIRHRLSKVLEQSGFSLIGEGTFTDLSSCDISFKDDRKERECKHGKHFSEYCYQCNEEMSAGKHFGYQFPNPRKG